MLALLLVIGGIGTAHAQEANNLTQREKIDWLVKEEIVVGRKVNADGSSELDLDDYVTRAEITKLLVFVLDKAELANTLYGQIIPFKDVPVNHWANELKRSVRI